MCRVAGACASGWAKALPPACPKSEPTIIDADDRDVFHLVAADPPTDEDFRSQHELQPDKHFENVTPCVTRSLSNWSTYAQCDGVRKFKRHKTKKIAKLSLRLDAGVISVRDDGHVSLWHCKAFDLVTASQVVG